jgi:hypothetical protein
MWRAEDDPAVVSDHAGDDSIAILGPGARPAGPGEAKRLTEHGFSGAIVHFG